MSVVAGLGSPGSRVAVGGAALKCGVLTSQSRLFTLTRKGASLMSSNPTRRIPPNASQADEESFAALKAIDDYKPANASYSLAAITTAWQSLEAKQHAETQAAAALAAARDEATSAEWDFHNLILGAKEQVIAQYGKDSNEVQAIGLKKKSEYAKSTGRKSATTEAVK